MEEVEGVERVGYAKLRHTYIQTHIGRIIHAVTAVDTILSWRPVGVFIS